MLLAIRRRLLGAGCGDEPRDHDEGGTTNLHTTADLLVLHALCEAKLLSHSLGVSAFCLIAPYFLRPAAAVVNFHQAIADAIVKSGKDRGVEPRRKRRGDGGL